jgi:hypothetical protein
LEGAEDSVNSTLGFRSQIALLDISNCVAGPQPGPERHGEELEQIPQAQKKSLFFQVLMIDSLRWAKSV